MGVDPACFGLYTENLVQNHAIPLKSIDVKAKIIESIATITYNQVYANNTNDTLNLIYMFPLSDGSVIDGFQARYKSYTIDGEIMKKEEAKKEYDEAIAEGKTAIYAEKEVTNQKIIKLQIGNMEPNTEISITLTLIEQVKIFHNKLWMYEILGNLKPKNSLFDKITQEQQQQQQQQQNSLFGKKKIKTSNEFLNVQNYPLLDGNDGKAYTWTINIQIEQKTKINFIKSPNYEIEVKMSENYRLAEISLNQSQKWTPSRDFILYFSCDEINKPKTLLTKFGDEYCAMVQYAPQSNSKTPEEAFKSNLSQVAESNSEDNDEENLDFLENKGEYIFLIDRSYSMEGQNIQMAKESLIIFLRSLPKNSYFNIVSFGTSCAFQYEKSQMYDPMEIQKVIQTIEKVFSANLGGTDIYKPIKQIFNDCKQIPGYQRNIYILTDGQVQDSQKVIKLVAKYTNFARFFTVGLGAGSSKELISSIADAGNGDCEYVENPQELSEKVMTLLHQSLRPSFHDFNIEVSEQSKLLRIVPCPSMMPTIQENKYITFFMFFSDEAQEVGEEQLKITFQQNNKNEESVDILEFNFSDILTDENPLSYSISKICFSKLIECIEKEKEIYYKSGNYYREEDIVELSEQYRILSTKTAFITVMKDENDKIASTNTTDIIIPQIQAPQQSQSLFGLIQQKVPPQIKSLYQPDDDDDQIIVKKKCKQQIEMKKRIAGSGLFGQANLQYNYSQSPEKQQQMLSFDSSNEKFKLNKVSGVFGSNSNQQRSTSGLFGSSDQSKQGRSASGERSKEKAQIDSFGASFGASFNMPQNSKQGIIEQSSGRPSGLFGSANFSGNNNYNQINSFGGAKSNFGGGGLFGSVNTGNNNQTNSGLDLLDSSNLNQESHTQKSSKGRGRPRKADEDYKEENQRLDTSYHNDAYKVIKLQSIEDGSWSNIDELKQIIKLNSQKFILFIQENYEQGLQILSLALTAFVIFWFRKYCIQQKTTWKFIAIKGEEFLKSKGKTLKDFQMIKDCMNELIE